MNAVWDDCTEVQKQAVTKLEKQGWRTTSIGKVQEEVTVYLCRRDRKLRALTHYCEVEQNGEVRA
jgi:hypothetical protein